MLYNIKAHGIGYNSDDIKSKKTFSFYVDLPLILENCFVGSLYDSDNQKEFYEICNIADDKFRKFLGTNHFAYTYIQLLKTTK